VIKLDIINEVVNKTGITKTKAELAVETVFGSMKRSLAKGDRIELRGFGVFNVRPRKTGIGRNPRTGAEVPFRRVKLSASNPAKNCSPSTEVDFSGTMEARALAPALALEPYNPDA
jgi:DNA-binding protein HU-beta